MRREASLFSEPASKKRKSQMDHIGEFMQLHKAQRMNPSYDPSQEAIQPTPGTSTQVDPPPATSAVFASQDVRFKAADHTANKKGPDNFAPAKPAISVATLTLIVPGINLRTEVPGGGQICPPSVKNFRPPLKSFSSLFFLMIQGVPRTYLGKVRKSGNILL